MKKTLVINMKDIVIEGDILDVTRDTKGIIYSISKEIDDEISVDYVDVENKIELKGRKYEAGTFFFNLNKLWSNRDKESLIKEVSEYLNEDGRFYIWDINKERGHLIDNKVKVILPNNKVKEIEFKNFNPLSTCSYDEVKKILEKYGEIEETKIWEDIFFIKAKKKIV